MSRCACAQNADGSVTTLMCSVHAETDPCLTMASVTGKRRKGTIRNGTCTSCGWTRPKCACMTEDLGDGLGERVVTHSAGCPEHPEYEPSRFLIQLRPVRDGVAGRERPATYFHHFTYPPLLSGRKAEVTATTDRDDARTFETREEMDSFLALLVTVGYSNPQIIEVKENGR